MRGAEDGEALARECFSRGYNCAESVLRGVCHAQGVCLGDDCLRMATPFGGGVGRSEGMCGALSGAVMAVGASLGRLDPAEDRLRSYEVARGLVADFVGAFGSSECRVLNKGDFGSAEHKVRCGRFVGEATSLAILALRERT